MQRNKNRIVVNGSSQQARRTVPTNGTFLDSGVMKINNHTSITSDDILNIEVSDEDGHKNGDKDSKTQATLSCQFCEKSFPSKSCLKVHLKVHLSRKNYKCIPCGRIFTHKDSYKVHMKKHETSSEMKGGRGQNDMRCDICAKSFTYRHVLARHRLIHTNEMNYICDSCGKKFSRKDVLEAHKRKEHLTDEPFICKFCDKVFGYKQTLVKHERTHTKEKPFSCSYCAKTFTRKDYMVQHQRLHEIRGTKFTCDVCKNTFDDKSALKIHMKKHVEGVDRVVRKKSISRKEKMNKHSVVVTPDQFPITEVFISENSSLEECYNEVVAENDALSTIEFN